jgi:hypothetical protein
VSRTRHPVDKGTDLAWERWRRRNLYKKRVRRDERLPVRDRRKIQREEQHEEPVAFVEVGAVPRARPRRDRWIRMRRRKRREGTRFVKRAAVAMVMDRVMTLFAPPEPS